MNCWPECLAKVVAPGKVGDGTWVRCVRIDPKTTAYWGEPTWECELLQPARVRHVPTDTVVTRLPGYHAAIKDSRLRPIPPDELQDADTAELHFWNAI